MPLPPILENKTNSFFFFYQAILNIKQLNKNGNPIRLFNVTTKTKSNKNPLGKDMGKHW